jgi:hypothetical protein
VPDVGPVPFYNNIEDVIMSKRVTGVQNKSHKWITWHRTKVSVEVSGMISVDGPGNARPRFTYAQTFRNIIPFKFFALGNEKTSLIAYTI